MHESMLTHESILDAVVGLLSQTDAVKPIKKQALLRQLEQQLEAPPGSLRKHSKFIASIMGETTRTKEAEGLYWPDLQVHVAPPRSPSPTSGYGSSCSPSPDISPDGLCLEEPGDVADTLCLICGDGDFTEDNHILLCDGIFEDGVLCPAAFHQNCLQQFQPMVLGNWLCPACALDDGNGFWRGGDNSGESRTSRCGPCFQAAVPELRPGAKFTPFNTSTGPSFRARLRKVQRHAAPSLKRSKRLSFLPSLYVADVGASLDADLSQSHSEA